MSKVSTQKITKTKKIFILLILILLALSIYLLSAFAIIAKKRHLPRLDTKKHELSVRGNILSSDNFKIASSKKIYKASLDTRYLDKNKKELFIKLFSIYSNIKEKDIRTKLNSKKGYVVLSYNIDSRTAKNLKELSYKLRRLKVFKSIKKNGTLILRDLVVNESGEKRQYAYNNTLTPVVGYIRKYEDDNKKTKVKGIKGLEKSYNELLNNSKDGILQGKRDVLSYVSFNKDSIIKNRIDGMDLKLNIPLKLQKNIEILTDKYKEKLVAKEVIVSILESSTGKVLSLATSKRFNPQRIRQKDLPALDVFAIESQFEPGSVIKPIVMSMVMESGKTKRNELIFAYNEGKLNSKGVYPIGKYPLGRFKIRDDHQFKKHYLTYEDIIAYSSNIGILQLAQRLRATEYLNWLEKFGLSTKTGIDLPYEKKGQLPRLRQFQAGESSNKDNVYKATVSYGQGMTTTFMQVLKAYTVFNNNGYITTPYIVSKISSQNKTIQIKPKKQIKVLSKRTTNSIKKMLITTVKKGTGKITYIKGLEIGGKTGTAQLARGGNYQKRYISSFFGFVNGIKNKYTIGVTVIEPISTGKYWYYHYASQSAAPLFRDVVKTLVKLNYLNKKD